MFSKRLDKLLNFYYPEYLSRGVNFLANNLPFVDKPVWFSASVSRRVPTRYIATENDHVIEGKSWSYRKSSMQIISKKSKIQLLNPSEEWFSISSISHDSMKRSETIILVPSKNIYVHYQIVCIALDKCLYVDQRD